MDVYSKSAQQHRDLSISPKVPNNCLAWKRIRQCRVHYAHEFMYAGTRYLFKPTSPLWHRATTSTSHFSSFKHLCISSRMYTWKNIRKHKHTHTHISCEIVSYFCFCCYRDQHNTTHHIATLYYIYINQRCLKMCTYMCYMLCRYSLCCWWDLAALVSPQVTQKLSGCTVL